MIEEHILLKDKGILISNARFVVEQEEVTHAIQAIETIQFIKGNKNFPTMFFLVGLGFLIAGALLSNSLIATIAILFFGICVFSWVKQEIDHTVEIRMSSGKKVIFQHTDLEFIERVIKALNDAIIFRG